MKKMNLRLVALLGVCALSGPVLAADNANVVVRDAWVRLPAASRTETSAYMVIENKGSIARSVVSVSSPEAAKIEMHEMKMMGAAKADAQAGAPHAAGDDHMAGMSHDAGKAKESGGMMMMSPAAKIEVPAKGKATLAPNGYHLMLFGLKSKLSDGGKVALTLKLDDGSTVPVTASVRRPE